MNVVKVTWPRKKGSKMIDIRFRQIDAWLYCMVGHQDEKDPKILICCWRWRPEDPCYLLLDIQLKIIVVWIMSEHCTEWSRRDPKINITYLDCCWSPAKIIILASDYIDHCCEWREGGMRVALCVWDSNWFCFMFQKQRKSKAKWMTIFSY